MTSHLSSLARRAERGMERLLQTVPFAREFHEGVATDRAYYRRDLIETVLRIRLNNEADTYCLLKLSRTPNRAGNFLAQYLGQEYGHDEVLARDLAAFGVTPEELARTRPFFATELLMGYLRYAIDRDGALPTFVWNWFVEWYSGRYNAVIVACARQAFGPDAVAGTQQHLELDHKFDHEVGMGAALAELVDSPEALDKALAYVDSFTDLIGRYFDELHAATLGPPQPPGRR